MQRGYFQPWKYITIEMKDKTVDGVCLNNEAAYLNKDGYLHDKDNLMFSAITVKAGLGEVGSQATAESGILFEVFEKPSKVAKVMVSGIAPIKVLSNIVAGEMVYWNDTGISPFGATEAKAGKVTLGIALSGGSMGDVVPVFLKQIRNYYFNDTPGSGGTP